MSIKIYKALPMYDNYLESFYKENDNIKTKTFDEQLFTLYNDFYSTRNFNWKEFNYDNNIELFETVNNAYFLQQEFYKQKYVLDCNWKKNIILNQIKDIQPDVCIIYPPEVFGTDFVQKIREQSGKKMLIGGMDGVDRQNISLFQGYDFVITCSKYISAYYEKNNMPTYALEYGFNPTILSRLEGNGKKYNVGFSGSIFEDDDYTQRLELLKYLINKTSIEIRSSFGINNHYRFISRKFLRAIKRNTWRDFLALQSIQRKNSGPVYGLKMFQFLHDSKITLNKHGDITEFAANVRLYEATGTGSCLLTDWKENIGDLFEPNKEIVTFTSKEEALDKINFLLKHDSQRDKIAKNGQQRTLSMYTEDKRIPGVLNFIKGLL